MSKIFERIKQNDLALYAVPILIVVGVYDLNFQFDVGASLVPVFSVLIVSLLFWYRYIHGNFRRIKFDYNGFKLFFPFPSRSEYGKIKNSLLSHEIRKSLSRKFICSNNKSAINVIYGESGAGKSSIFIDLNAEMDCSCLIERLHPNSYFGEILKNCLNVDELKISEIYNELLSLEASDVSFDDRMLDLLQEYRYMCDRYIFLDQCESLWLGWDKLQKNNQIRLLKLLRAIDQVEFVRLFFIVKSDVLDLVLQRIENHRPSLFHVESVHILPDSDNEHKLVERLSKSLDDFLIKKILSYLNKRKEISSFEIQLLAHIAVSVDEDYICQWIDRDSDSESVISFYISILGNEYCVEKSNKDMLVDFEAVIYTLAVLNEYGFEALSLEKISGFSHVPLGNCWSVIDFLQKARILDCDQYRFRHDLISKEVIGYGFLALRDDYKTAIWRLAKNHDFDGVKFNVGVNSIIPYLDAFEKVKGVSSFSSIYRSSTMLLVSIMYWYRIHFPEKSFEILESFRKHVPDTGFDLLYLGSLSNFQTGYFQLTAIVLYVWFIFLMSLERGVIAKLEPSHRSGFMMFFLYLSYWFGPLLGLLFSFSDVNYIIAIVFCGQLLGFNYLLMSVKTPNRKSLFARTTFRYFWQISLVNMIISLSVWFISRIAMLEAGYNEVPYWGYAIHFGISFLFCLFALLMRSGQGGERAHWGLMAMYDDARLFKKI